LVERGGHPRAGQHGGARAARGADAVSALRHRPAEHVHRGRALHLAAGLPGSAGVGAPRDLAPAAPGRQGTIGVAARRRGHPHGGCDLTPEGVWTAVPSPLRYRLGAADGADVGVAGPEAAGAAVPGGTTSTTFSSNTSVLPASGWFRSSTTLESLI